MSYELKMKLLMHLVCIVQWGVFALIHWEMLGKGRWKHPFACTVLALCGMLVISLWIDFGFFNAASIAFNVLYLLVTSAFFGGTIRQKLMSCMANGVVCLLTENTVIYLYTYLEAVPPAQVIRQPLGVLLMAAAMLIVGGITAQMAKHWGQKQALEPLQLVVAMFFPGVVVVLNMLLMARAAGSMPPSSACCLRWGSRWRCWCTCSLSRCSTSRWCRKRILSTVPHWSRSGRKP